LKNKSYFFWVSNSIVHKSQFFDMDAHTVLEDLRNYKSKLWNIKVTSDRVIDPSLVICRPGLLTGGSYLLYGFSLRVWPMWISYPFGNFETVSFYAMDCFAFFRVYRFTPSLWFTCQCFLSTILTELFSLRIITIDCLGLSVFTCS
jgi:hypothetical protein